MTEFVFRAAALGANVNGPLVVAGLPQIEASSWTRLVALGAGGDHRRADLPFVVVGLAVISDATIERILALGRTGEVAVLDASLEVEALERIADAGLGPGRYGYLTGIRQIGAETIACGHMGQIYRRRAGGWARADHGSRVRDPFNLGATSHKALDGTSPDDFYAVGSHGRVYHFSGQGWRDVSPATNVDLLCVEKTRTGTVLIGGKKGVLFLGSWDRWSDLTNSALEATIWDIAAFGDAYYLATGAGLWRTDLDLLTKVDLPDVPPQDAYHLVANACCCYYVGHRTVFWGDGTVWKRVNLSFG
jgi:hypothetical protein